MKALGVIVFVALVAAISVQAASAAPTPIRIQKCFAAKSGLPCYAFKNRARVVKRVRASLLYYDGFRPAMTFAYPNARKIHARGIQDGDRMEVTVVKSGRRQVWVAYSTFCIRDAYGQYATSGGPCGGSSFTINLPFVA
jgi:hypothetical protein